MDKKDRFQSAIRSPDGIILGRPSRRKFFTTSSAMGLAMGIFAADGLAQSNGDRSIASNFNGTPLPASGGSGSPPSRTSRRSARRG